jgi:hypothetical protein
LTGLARFRSLVRLNESNATKGHQYCLSSLNPAVILSLVLTWKFKLADKSPATQIVLILVDLPQSRTIFIMRLPPLEVMTLRTMSGETALKARVVDLVDPRRRRLGSSSRGPGR